jgi:hypothetical protein
MLFVGKMVGREVEKLFKDMVLDFEAAVAFAGEKVVLGFEVVEVA